MTAAGIASPSLTAEQLDRADSDLEIAVSLPSDADDPMGDDIFDNVYRAPSAPPKACIQISRTAAGSPVWAKTAFKARA